LILAFAFVWGAAVAVAQAGPAVGNLKITILSTMLADDAELGEWGFSALVEVDGHRILFDTGNHADLVLKNARTLGIDLTAIPEVVLSHNHSDHVGGLMTLRQSVLKAAPMALARVHVAKGIFDRRSLVRPRVEDNPMIRIRPEYEKTGGVFIVHDGPAQLYPGVWLTGPIRRKYPERNWDSNEVLILPSGTVEDNIPEDMSMVFDTRQGLVILTGCGHAGIVNIADYSRRIVRPARLHAIVGGIHLFSASEETCRWTAGKLNEFGVDNFMGAHCTGIETVYIFRRELRLDRAHAVVGAVGASFILGKGIDPGDIAQ
jgi:7,8-dihydropterin-6-yl-methyl-4-(beta-D-ribofuranosyl)aminobenzene 5'-phosphate synthase